MIQCLNQKQKTQSQSRLDGSAAQKPQWRSALPLDATAFSAEDRARFEEKVVRKEADKCWEWLGAVDKDGYGRMQYHGRSHGAHRIAFRMLIGEIPRGLLVCHTCDNPPCCNPAHLVIGSTWDNALDKYVKGRYAKGEDSFFRKHPEAVMRGENHPFRKNPLLHVRGEGVNTAKLTSEQVVAMRRRYSTGKYSVFALSKQFKISKCSVWQIVTGKTWRHLL